MQRDRTSNRGVTLTFLGTRGEIELRSRWHRRHSSLLVQHSNARVMIDCGADWLGLLDRISPTAIVLTHAHPDHAWGLAEGVPCPVYATSDTWKSLAAYPIQDRRIIPLQKPVTIGGFRIEAFPLEHSIRAPAVGYRISAGRRRLFYAPDLVAIRDRHHALRGIDLYIGDGSTTTRPLVRRRAQTLIGHTPISTQLGWCMKEEIHSAIFTHCGSEIVGGDARRLNAVVRKLGAERGVRAILAHDGLRLSLRPRRFKVLRFRRVFAPCLTNQRRTRRHGSRQQTKSRARRAGLASSRPSPE
jgi:phosphoribosyl 1,2-cyclic phosphodiesterase